MTAMTRVDVWDVKPAAVETISLGLPRTNLARYTFGDELGRGGFGVVRVVTDRFSGEQLACKSIAKQPGGPNWGSVTQEQYIDRLQREIEVLQRLQQCRNVVQLKQVFEDDTHVHILMEWCKGGQLWHRIGRAHYSEKTVSSYMRAVLRTIKQCHARHILHRDIKPSNFLLLSDEPYAPLKAVDFGLAVFYDPEQLPLTNLGLDGTPWFMAPEVLNHEVGPESDVWSAGVMAYQLLSGYLPFDDYRNPKSPSVSRIWKAIFTEEPKMVGSSWADISDEAKDFVNLLLSKDPKQRPTAKQALAHPWLHGGRAEDRATGKPLNERVVQRIKNLSNDDALLKQSVIDLMAAELLKSIPASESTDGSAEETEALRGHLDPHGHMHSALHGLGGHTHVSRESTPRTPCSAGSSQFGSNGYLCGRNTSGSQRNLGGSSNTGVAGAKKLYYATTDTSTAASQLCNKAARTIHVPDSKQPLQSAISSVKVVESWWQRDKSRLFQLIKGATEPADASDLAQLKQQPMDSSTCRSFR